MGKTHKALERAEDQYRKQQIRISHKVFSKDSGSTKGRASVRKNIKHFGDLKKKLLVRNSNGSIKSVLFIKTFNGGKSSDHAVKFATSLAEDPRLKVLLVDLNLWTIDLQEVFETDYALFLSDLFSGNGRRVPPIKKIGPGNLFKTWWGGNHSRLADSFNSGEFDQFFKNIYEKFDYLILNVPERIKFQECRLLCSKVDAVVLILKSDKIAGQIALNAKKHFQNPAEKLLGMVISNTKTYRHNFLKTTSVVMSVCLIFTVGFLIGNSRLKPRGTRFLPNYIGAIPNIQGNKPIRPEKVVDLAQLNHHEITMSIGEQVHESSKPMPASNKIQQEKPAMTSKTAPFTESTFKAGQTRVNDHKRKNESDSNKVDQPMRDGKKTAGLTMEKEIEKPILSRDNGSEGKRKAESRQGKVVVVKKGETLFRIIYRTYGTYNAKIVNLVLKENPKIINATNIVAGQAIKLPEIN